MLKNRVLYPLISVLFITACGSDGKSPFTGGTKEAAAYERPELDLKDYQSWVSDNQDKLVINKTMGDIEFRCQLVPSEMIAIQEAGDAKLKKNELNDYQKLVYFNLQIASNNNVHPLNLPSIFNTGSEKMRYLSMDFRRDIFLVTDGDTSWCELFNMERDNGIRPFLMFQLGFPLKKESPGEHILIINDGCFATGIHKFKYSEEVLSEIPKLSVDENPL